MVIQEISQDRHVWKHRVLCDSIMDVSHRLLILEGILEFVVHGIVQSGIQRSLVAYT